MGKEDFKEFTPSGADEVGKIDKQDWELPHSVSAPPEGFSTNVESTSYDGYGEEHTTDYHPPVEQGEFLHPFKVNRYKNEDDESEVRVRLGRLFYNAGGLSMSKVEPHGPHGEVQNVLDSGGSATGDTTAGTTPMIGANNSSDDGNTNGLWPQADKPSVDASEYAAGLWALESAYGDTHVANFGTAALLTGEGHIPLQFYGPAAGDPPSFRNGDKKMFATLPSFDGVSSVWLMYLIYPPAELGVPAIYSGGGSGREGVQLVHVEGTSAPTTLAELAQAGAARALGTDRKELMWQNPRNEGEAGNRVADFKALEDLSSTSDSDARKTGVFYLKIAELAAIDDEDSEPVDQIIHDNIYLTPTWFTLGVNNTSGTSGNGLGYNGAAPA